MLRVSILFLLSLLVLGCNSSNEETPVPEEQVGDGDAVAFMNGEYWEANVEVEYPDDDYDKLSLVVFREERPGRFRHTLELNGIEPMLGRQVLLVNSGDWRDNSIYYILDVDAIFNVYDIDGTATDNYIDIQRFDPASLEIEGTFNISLTSNFRDPATGEQLEDLQFTQGEFTAKVEPGWFD